MNLIWTDAARDDLVAIGNHIAHDNPVRATSFVNEIIARGEGIADLPRGFPSVARFERFSIRRRPVGRYLIFYRLTAETVEILHVLHEARDYTRLLALEGRDDE